MHKNIICFVLIFSVLCVCHTAVFGHNVMLSVSYDPCRPMTYSKQSHFETATAEGEDEWWYTLFMKGNTVRHIGNEVKTIKYYFADCDGSYYWTTDATEEEAEEIKKAYANSMKKWNDIYYFTYDANGNRIANKIINIIECTEDEYNDLDFNIVIYPSNTIDANANSGILDNIDIPNSPTHSEPGDGLIHLHYNKWEMNVNVLAFKGEYSDEIRERTGAHEMGHVLGLFDLDEECDHTIPNDNHHQEVLMGYGGSITRPTYKDIAGVSITRGFHTDADHIWMLRDNLNDDSSHNSYDVICALCNGVKYGVDNDVIVNGTNYTYLGEEIELFGSCNGEHRITGGNMLLVATDMVRDFYKCLHCRYIEEAEHTNHVYSHQWKKYDNTYHIEQCGCGATGTHKALHAIRASEIVVDRARCIGCGGMVRIDPTDGFTPVIQNVQKVSINGSYILPNGVIVLVDEDVEAYYNGTLVFYDKDNLPQTE